MVAGRAGNWVLLEGLDATITKTATLVPEFLDEDVHIIRPLQFHTQVRIISPFFFAEPQPAIYKLVTCLHWHLRNNLQQTMRDELCFVCN